MSFNINGKEVLIPTVVKVGGKWKVVSPQAALRVYRRTGENLGIFDSAAAANAYAVALHNQQSQEYAN